MFSISETSKKGLMSLKKFKKFTFVNVSQIIILYTSQVGAKSSILITCYFKVESYQIFVFLGLQLIYSILLNIFIDIFTKKGLVAHRSSHQRCSIKNELLKISQNSQETSTCTKVSFFIKL